MQAFARVYRAVDESTGTRDKVRHLADWFRIAAPADAAWSVYAFAGGKLKRSLASASLKRVALELSGYPEWLFDECYSHVGDLAETITLLAGSALPAAARTAADGDGASTAIASAGDIGLADWVARLGALAKVDEPARVAAVVAWLAALDDGERFALMKLVTGSLRVGVSKQLVVQALAEATGLDRVILAERLSGDWKPSADSWERLVAPADALRDANDLLPYPFFLASPLEAVAGVGVDAPWLDSNFGARGAWLAEWKWDGIRAQLLRTDAGIALWSRGDERLDGRFPELEAALTALPPGTVVDGEIVAWDGKAPRPFTALQRRIGLLKPPARTLKRYPVHFIAYDLLRDAGNDLRALPLAERRVRLEALLAAHPGRLGLSEAIAAGSWAALEQLRGESRARRVEGLMLKRLASPYQIGRKRGDWWKWKVDPLTIDAVLVYAQPGHGRRSNLYTDYTFALWHDGKLLPVAKAYSGLNDSEIGKLDRWIRTNTEARFGPVRQLTPLHVFELGFEAVNRSTRHKSGIAVRFPRILRWRHDKPAAEADLLDTLRALAVSDEPLEPPS